MTVLFDERVTYPAHLTHSSRIPYHSGGTLAAGAMLSARAIRVRSSFGSLEASSEGDSWFGEAVGDLIGWVNKDEGWDSYGARRISPQVARRVAKLLHQLASSQVPRPFITGTSTGGLNLQWESDRYDLQFTFEERDSSALYWNKEEGEEWEGPLERAASALQAITRDKDFSE
ncbi:hypothetical protein CO540_17460 [Micromonospora sp. WMMA2032]|uniref:hypothetical protein n=1 Tax=Micromonospora sp. WMMA2032 TaxID=2039870 RepID=UPI000C05961D|nr:hypothetical protein [Micromonospora sp. WMMA2032]ATO15404.1 hypothetical protein CO540_17460 [Micromonospora sp. WMMA2032]